MPDIDYKTRSRNGGNAQNQTGAWRATGKATGERYRYIEDKPQDGATTAADGANANEPVAAAKTRSRPNSEYVLYAYGEPVAMSADGDTSYFSTDILGSVRSVTDRNGQVKASYEYDAFGSPYLANLENDVGFGYCGKVYDSATGLYDYGFRDYNSASARFITVDPIRDGSNWYSYCMNDAVNYVDLFGLNPISDLVDDFVDGAKELAGKAKKAANNFINGKQVVETVNGQEITVQQSSPLLVLATILKYEASAGLIVSGIINLDPGLISAGIEISQVPTGRVDNQTGDYLAFAGEHSELGQAYLAPGVTYVQKDYVTTRGEYSGYTVKTSSLSNMTVATEGTTLSDGTLAINNTWNGVKSFLRDTNPGQTLNAQGGLIQKILGHPLTTEPYGVYNNSQVLTNSVIGRNDKFINLNGLSGNLNVFAGKKESNNGTNYANPQYFSENNNSASSANNVTFKNINFDGSGSVYIGFNGFSMGCSK